MMSGIFTLQMYGFFWEIRAKRGKANLAFLKQLLPLKSGIPSHDTINRIFQVINPRQLERTWMKKSFFLRRKDSIFCAIYDGKAIPP
jgi:hypothetical protein